MKGMVLFMMGMVFAGTAFAQDEAPAVKNMPPSVVKTFPECGDTAVDAAATTQIRVTFSKDMMDGSWSYVKISDDTFPQVTGAPKYLDDKSTCVVDVKLEPKKTYVIWFNSKSSGNFKDTDGRPAVPYLLVFQTR